MSIFETINSDIKKAMLEKDKVKLSALRAVKSAFLLEKTAKGASAEIPPEIELKILQKLVKQRKDTAEIYKSNNRQDLYENEIVEAEIIEAYLPKQMSEKEIREAVKEIIQEIGANSMKDMGKVMANATKSLAGKANGKIISGIVKEFLS